MAGYFGKAHIILDRGKLIMIKEEEFGAAEIELSVNQARKISTCWIHEAGDTKEFIKRIHS